MDNPKFQKGNLIFLTSLMMDFIYVVTWQRDEKTVFARKIDSPPTTQPEELDVTRVVKLAEEQEKLFPCDINQAIHKQRSIVFAPPKKKGVKQQKKQSMEKLLKGVGKESLDEILNILSSVGLTRDDIEEEEEGV